MTEITDKKRYLAVDSAYEKRAKPNVNGFDLIFDGETIDAFLNKKTKEIIVGIRGTSNMEDVKADVNLVANRLAQTSRYAKDLIQFKQLVRTYPPSDYTYHLNSHSLGGAVARQLIRDYPFIKSSVGFNPAKQIKDLNEFESRNMDYYINKDPLYNTFGRFSKDNKKVFEYKPKRPSGFFGWLRQKATPTVINAHKLENFKPIVGAGLQEKYVPKGLSQRDKKKQIKSIKEKTIRPKVDYPTKKSKWTKKAEEYFKGDTSIENISKTIGVPIKGLKEVIKKGEKAYYTSGSRPNIHPVQWGIARLYSLLFGNELVRRMDKAIIDKYKIPILKV